MMLKLSAGEKIMIAGMLITLLECVQIYHSGKPARKRYSDNVVNFTRYKEGKELLSRIAEDCFDNDPAA